MAEEMALALPAPEDQLLALAGRVADQEAAAGVFANYRQRLAANTRRRQDADLDLFARFLAAAGIPTGD